MLHAAARAAAGSEHAPVGVLEISPLESEAGVGAVETPVTIEAGFAYQGARRVVQRLDVRAQTTLDRAAVLEVTSSALLRFGSQRYTNFVLGRAPVEPGASPEAARAGDHELLDVTVFFPSRFPWLARNLLLASEVSSEELAACTELCDALGVRWHLSQGLLDASRHQLRAPVTEARQLEAFRLMLDSGLRVTLYAARLPTTQSVRIEAIPADEQGARRIDVTLSRGLQGSTPVLSSDAEAMQRLFVQRLGVRFSGRSWRVLNAHADAEDVRERPTAAPKGALKWQALRRRR